MKKVAINPIHAYPALVSLVGLKVPWNRNKRPLYNTRTHSLKMFKKLLSLCL